MLLKGSVVQFQLSGGEKTRLQFAKVFSVPSNVLMLDEPTNFIDLHTIEALEELIQSYPETALFKSHDKQFVENCADKVYIIQNKCLKEK